MKRILFFLALMCVLCVSAQGKYSTAWISQLLGSELMNANGEKISTSDLKGKVVGVYFSAHWCPPCRQFTPKLVKFRNSMVKQKKKFEVVFVSLDKSETEMMNYMQETSMKWLAVPFEGSRRKDIQNKYGVSGIPTLIILGPDGNIVTKNGRGDVTRSPEDAFGNWIRNYSNLNPEASVEEQLGTAEDKETTQNQSDSTKKTTSCKTSSSGKTCSSGKSCSSKVTCAGKKSKNKKPSSSTTQGSISKPSQTRAVTTSRGVRKAAQ